MNRKERFYATIERKPVDLSATPSSGIPAIAYSNLVKHIGRQDLPVQIYDVVQQLAQPLYPSFVTRGGLFRICNAFFKATCFFMMYSLFLQQNVSRRLFHTDQNAVCF